MNAFQNDRDYARFCQEGLQDPYPLFHRLREMEPVHWCPPLNLWLVSRFEDAFQGLRDTRLSVDRSSMYRQPLPVELQAEVGPMLEHLSKWLLLVDEPDHGRLRKLVNQAFSSKLLNSLRPAIENRAKELLAGIETGRPFDLVAQFSAPLPAIVICELLGIPLQERDVFRAAAGELMKFSTRGGPTLRSFARSGQAALENLIPMFQRLVEERRRMPQNDLFTALVQAQRDGQRLSDAELYALCVFIFVAGHETTNGGIASGILTLLRYPEQGADLTENLDGLVGGAIEETLRYESPVSRAVRRARQDLQIGGRSIGRDQTVVFLLGAANRDPVEYADPDRFDIRRKIGRQLAFGGGAHFCLGAFLARMEMEVAFRVLIPWLPKLRLPSDPLTWKTTMGVRSLEALPVVPA